MATTGELGEEGLGLATTEDTSTSGGGGDGAATSQKRNRVFLGELPEDFLRVESTVAPQQTIQQRADHPHLVPLTYAQSAAPRNNFAGKLKITIAQAKLNKNYGFTRMDPYCRVRVGHTVYETATDVNGSKNPRWNKSFACNLPRGVTGMYLEVFNERYLAIDDRVAWSHYEFPDDLFQGETMEEWVKLSGKLGDGQEGDLNVILSFSPATSYQLVPPAAVPVAPFAPTAYYPQPVYPGTVPYIGYQPAPVPQGQPYYPQHPPPQQQQQAPPPQQAVREEDIEQLQEMFPKLEKEVITSVMEANRGQVEPSVTALLQMSETQ